MSVYLKQFGQGMPLVFFHGWGFDSGIWLPLVPALSPMYAVILVDLPGFGHSGMMDWPCFRDSLLEQLPSEFAVVGWSLGGLYATRLALERPERVHFLLNVCSSPCFLRQEDWPGIDSSVLAGFHQRLLMDPKATLKEFVRLQTKNTHASIDFGSKASQAGLEAGLHSLATWDLRQVLKTIQLPTAFLFGKLDPLASIKTMNVMQRSYPDFHYVLFNKSAHLPFLSQTEDFIHALLGFIS